VNGRWKSYIQFVPSPYSWIFTHRAFGNTEALAASPCIHAWHRSRVESRCITIATGWARIFDYSRTYLVYINASREMPRHNNEYVISLSSIISASAASRSALPCPPFLPTTFHKGICSGGSMVRLCPRSIGRPSLSSSVTVVSNGAPTSITAVMIRRFTSRACF
jgi:hypothetical protein